MNNLQLQKIYSANELAAMVSEIASASIRFCAAYSDTLIAMPEVKNELVDLGFSVSFLNRAERIGRGNLDSRLLLASGRQYLKLSGCPNSEQKAAFDQGVFVYDNETCDGRLIPLASLSQIQINQSFAIDHVRTLAEQRTWLSEHQAKTESPVLDRDYAVHKKFVDVFKPGRFSKAILKQWLKEMGE